MSQVHRPLLIFGFREESWPKGHGYLYFKHPATGPSQRLFDVDLYNTQYDVVRSLFKDAIEEAVRRIGFSKADVSALAVEVENMSSIARTALLLEIADYIGKDQ